MQKERLWWSILGSNLRENWKDQTTKVVMGREGKGRDNVGGKYGLAFSSFSQGGHGGRQERKKQGEQSPSAEDLCIYILIMVT